MENQPQHYFQCVAEVQKGRILVADLQRLYGGISILTFNDDPLAKINSMTSVGKPFNGDVRSIIIGKN